MPRFLLLAALLAAVPAASAQVPGTPPTPADSAAVADTLAAPVITPDPDRARELFRTGQDQSRAGNHEQALATYDEALLYAPGFAPALVGRAQALAQLRRLEDAQAAFRVALDAATGPENAQVRTAAQRGLTQVTEVIEQRAAAMSAQASAQETAARQAAAVQQAVSLLQTDPLSADAATQALGLLDGLKAEGLDMSAYAFQYARAYTALGRGAEAVPYAQAAVESAQGDASAFYIQLGLAHRQAGNTAEARAAFESAKTGSWAGWAEHYLREMDAETGG